VREATMETTTPIQYGELLRGTNLRRRWEGKREVCPEYVGPEAQLGERLDAAKAQALAVGYRAFRDGGVTYAFLGGDWYVWSAPALEAPGRMGARRFWERHGKDIQRGGE
jgi:hypothetical protein